MALQQSVELGYINHHNKKENQSDKSYDSLRLVRAAFLYAGAERASDVRSGDISLILFLKRTVHFTEFLLEFILLLIVIYWFIIENLMFAFSEPAEICHIFLLLEVQI